MKELQDIDLKELIEQETGEKFNKEGYIKCPFHNEKTPSMSIKFFPDRNKYKFMCWGCNEQGDALDFVTKFKRLNYKSAREYLGFENEKTQKELDIDKVKNYIKWQIDNTEYKRGYKLLGLFPFVDTNNKVIYYKAKLLKANGKKETPYYHVADDGKVINKRGSDEVPYNLYNVLDGIKNQKTIIFVEGEKDANIINSILKGMDYVTTSIKGCTDLSVLKNGFKFRIYCIGDTGEAGEQYKWHIYKQFNSLAMEFKFINLPGLKTLGDNKDVTDWLESGHDKKDLLNAFNRSLDLKSPYELQQDSNGIYKLWYDKKLEDYRKHYMTDFKLIEAKRLRFIEDDKEGVKLILKSCTNEILEKIGPSSVFDDVKSFKNFLGTLDLAFKGKADDVTDLKSWINKYFAIENEERYLGVKFIKKNDKLTLVTGNGAITAYGLDHSLVADNSEINIIEKESISKEELIELKKRIFRFAVADKAIPIVGTTINDLAVYQNQEAKEKLHHLLIVGESGSGKTTILENVVAPILNYPLKDKKSIGMITNFAMIRDLSTGNYPSLYDEFKPSMMDRYKLLKLSDVFRNLYDRSTVARGNKSFETNKEFRFMRPLIMAGEENYPNQEKAAIERSCIVYISKRERTQEHTDSMMWLTKNENILNKFGRSIINEILNLSVEQYKDIRQESESKFNNLSNRALTTAVNISCGIEIFNVLLERHGLKKIENYERHIFQNIKEEVLDGGSDTKSTIEQMLTLYNNMIEDGRAYDSKNVVIDRGDGLFIRTSEMINQIHMFVNQVGSAEVVPLKLNDFKKQSKKSGYLLKSSSKVIKIDNKPVRFDEYSKERTRELNLHSIVEPELTEIPIGKQEQKVIDGVFGI
ncbi:CHC2 zinc finger domain-containing protein [Clostridium botulinum]|uniref:DNA primase n=1 Tax=Clostridium botulinum TaxID=1491 RepID=A0A6B4JHL0_CLOBO|nr:CHC2 zinc finger domain-containing protein [Clostridium botulinum]EES48987.1 DNA primase related protein [Clostridium botulinum E1 str. 'BoNT E Beluga']MBY6759708.1 DNA primase [Clostridium botulinum]MBY6918617.1 DNA primase [Clostridium botulinum]MCR1129700.1 CHC2 zinc finger domain-containing protein [Clostridium botulinum]NFJ56430.1 DNA primase [Clostridium botulinum]